MSRLSSSLLPIFALLTLTLPPAWSQHDAERNAVRHIAAGKFDAAAAELEKKSLPGYESERLFVEMLSLLAQDQAKAALVKAQAAVEAGLPFERLLAGPRQPLQKLHALPAFQSWRREVDPPALLHGPLLGAVTHASAKVWVRTSREAQVWVDWREAGADRGTLAGQRVTGASDYTAAFDLLQLQPSTEYHYTVRIDGAEPGPSHGGVFTSAPAPGTAGRFAVGFGGGAGFVPEWERMWDTILTFEPDAFLMLGDNVYIDDPEHLLTNRSCYYRRQSRPEWRRFTARTAIYSIYDDHDFGTNDCVPGPAIENPPWKRKVWNTFRRNWANPAYGGGENHPGCWYDFQRGDVHFILLDGRYYRDRKGGTMLGPVQKKWLLERLKTSTGTFKVIASPVPFTPGIKPGSKDPWDGYPEEREEIFTFLESNRIESVFLVAADRHRTDLRVIDRPNGYPLYEFESSRLTNRHTHPVVKTEGLVWGYKDTCSFGLMRFDTAQDDPQVTFEAIDIDGKVRHSHVLKRSQLGFPP